MHHENKYVRSTSFWILYSHKYFITLTSMKACMNYIIPFHWFTPARQAQLFTILYSLLELDNFKKQCSILFSTNYSILKCANHVITRDSTCNRLQLFRRSYNLLFTTLQSYNLHCTGFLRVEGPRFTRTQFAL